MSKYLHQPSRFLSLLGSLFVAGVCGLGLAQAQPGAPLWTNSYVGPSNLADEIRAMALGPNGNVYVTGSSFGTNGWRDLATVGYSSAGVPLWTNRYDGPPHYGDYGNAITVDPQGNVYVAGETDQDNYFSPRFITIKYSDAGVPLWTNIAGEYSGALNLAADKAGNIYAAGYVGSYGYYDYLVTAYSSSGAILWTNSYGGPGNDFAMALVVDVNTNLYVSGYSGSVSNGNDWLILKLSSSGVPVWTNHFSNPGDSDDEVGAAAVDSSGNLYVTGMSSTNGQYSYWSSDFLTIKYSATGIPLWTNSYNGSGTNYDHAAAIAVHENSGHVYVTGTSTETNSAYDLTTIAYSLAGTPLWTNHYAGPGTAEDHGIAIAVDGSGNCFVTGLSYESGIMNWCLTVAYSGAGVPLWTNRISGGAETGANAIAVDAHGDVYVGGATWGGATQEDYVAIKYAAIPPAPDLLSIQRQGSHAVLSWNNPMFNLQTASVSSGPFTNLPGATSPHTNPISGSERFFRLRY